MEEYLFCFLVPALHLEIEGDVVGITADTGFYPKELVPFQAVDISGTAVVDR